jgi:hypothetical protein
VSGLRPSPWRNWFRGIDHAAGLSSIACGVNCAVVRGPNVQAAGSSPRFPGLAFYISHGGKFHTENQTIFEFLRTANRGGIARCRRCGVALRPSEVAGEFGLRPDPSGATADYAYESAAGRLRLQFATTITSGRFVNADFDDLRDR